MDKYLEFLKRKIKVAENFGFEIDKNELNAILKPHQKDIVTWALNGGRRAVFASFGMGKTIMQLDLIERLIERYTNKDETVLDPFGGIGSTSYQAMKMQRKGITIELHDDYWKDSLKHLQSLEYKENTPTLFDLIENEQTT